MQVGVLVESEDGLTWERWRHIAATVDGLGFDSLWVSDHFLTPAGEDLGGIEAWTALAVAAAETRRVGLGPLVSPVTFRPPGVMARMTRGLDTLSAGRFVVGLGLGWNEAEHHALGIPFPGAAQRAELLEAAASLLRAEQLHRVPLLIGGMGERLTLPLVARFADEWNLTTNDPAVVVRKTHALARLGRQPGSLRCSVSIGLLIAGTSAALEERCLAMQRIVPALGQVSLSEVPGAARATGWVVGTPEEVVTALRALADAGVNRVMLGHYDQSDDAALELVAREILPALA